MSIYKKALRTFVTQVEKEMGRDVEALIVYGSVARDEATEESDIDLVVVLKRHNPEIASRIEQIRDSVVFDFGKAITLDFETYASLAKMVQCGDPFAYNVLSDGKPLLDHNGCFPKLRTERVKVHRA
ncbi:MAG TPA: nucleotidyltransferase domain-containing protein [Candidatus Bipolaricaulota bacterium]